MSGIKLKKKKKRTCEEPQGQRSIPKTVNRNTLTDNVNVEIRRQNKKRIIINMLNKV